MQLQKSLEQYEKSQKILKSVVVQHIGVGAVFGVAKDFFPNSPKLSRKKLHKSYPQKEKKLFMLFWEPLGVIFAHIFRGLIRFSGIL